MNQISGDLDRRGAAGIAAKQRCAALQRWLDSNRPLSFNENTHPHLLLAIIPFECPQLTLTPTHIGSKSILFLIEAILIQCK